MKILFINGPPGSGKDYTGELLRESSYLSLTMVANYVICDKFARALKETCHAAYGLVDLHGKPLPHDWFEESKSKSMREFFGKTPREIYIAFSETYMKPLHGPRVWGEKLLNDTLVRECGEIIITDSGFREEAEVFVEHFGNNNCRLVRLHREGYTFKGDSRNYVFLEDLGVKCYDVNNPGTRDGLLSNLRQAICT